MSLIQTIDQVKAFSSILNASANLDMLKPYLSDSEVLFIRLAVGREFLADLATKLDSTDENWKTALSLTRKPLVLYALYLAIDEIGVSLSGQGVQVASSPTNTPAPQFKVMNSKQNLMSRANAALDDLLELLELNKKTFTSYKGSDVDLLISNAAEFSKYVDIRGSRRVFLAMIPIIRSIESKFIKPILSDGLFAKLKSALQGSSDLSEDYNSLMELIKPALAHLAMARSLDEISIDVLDWGVFANAESTFTNIMTKQTANRDRILAMQAANQLDGDGELKSLQIFLDVNASKDKYSDYFSSSLYSGPSAPGSVNQYDNNGKNLFFA
jgi:hypothetical protein